MTAPEILLDVRAHLGEGPVWDDRAQCLWWIDISSGLIHRLFLDDGTHDHFALGQKIGAIGLGEDGGLICAMRDGFARFDPATEHLDWIVDPEADRPGNRFNDGKPAPDGSFIAGTMSDSAEPHQGSLYRLSVKGDVTTLKTGVSISNGIAWTMAEDRMYFIDSVPRIVFRFEYDRTTGRLSDPQEAFRVPAEAGSPDGMTIDTDDKLWIAHWDGRAVRRWDPESGTVLEVIDVPTPRVTSCTFGGPKLDTLYITTAREGLSQEQLRADPAAGALFRVQTSARGRPPYRFLTGTPGKY